MRRLLKRIVVKVISRLTEGSLTLDYWDLSKHELNAVAVQNLVGINKSLYVLARRTLDYEEEIDEEAREYPENHRPEYYVR